jgi:hypothetical protein
MAKQENAKCFSPKSVIKMEEKTVYTLSPNKEDFSDHQHSRIE